MYYITYYGDIQVEEDEIITQESSLEDCLFKKHYEGWSPQFEKRKGGFMNALMLIQKQNSYFFPLKKDIFNCFGMTPLKKVKCVIWGEDPYPQKFGELPRATGMSFSVRRGDSIPGSLKNIYREIASNYPGKFNPPDHGDLSKWCKEGVLLMNTASCYDPNDPKKYKKKWITFTYQVIDILNAEIDNCIHVLWGNNAKTLKCCIRSKQEYILESAHPSPLSARRGFFGNKHFVKINVLLKKLNKSQIDFNLDEVKKENRTYLENISPIQNM